VLWVAQRLRIPTVLQEQNSFPGLTTKKLAKHATAVCVGFEDAQKRIPGANAVFTGNPLRFSFRTLQRKDAQAKWPLDFARQTLLVVGGSAGARSINEVVSKTLSSLTARYNVIWQTGKTGVPASHDQEFLQAEARARHLVVREFIDDMPSVFAVTDLAICRAGAMTLAELAAAGVPAVLVPYPFATDDHQTVNAQSVVKAGAALMIRDSELSTDTLVAAIASILDDVQRHRTMAEAMRSLAKPNAALDIADIAFQAARKKA